MNRKVLIKKLRNTHAILAVFLVWVLVAPVLAVYLPPSYLGTDPNEDDVDDEIDMNTLHLTNNGTHIRFIIERYEEIEVEEEEEEAEWDFEVILNIGEGQGDDRKNIAFAGADFAVEAQKGKVYYWDGKDWKENKSASVQVEVVETNVTLTCRINDIDLGGASGDLEIGFLSNDEKVGKGQVNKAFEDRAPDQGWYTVEGGVPGLGLSEVLVTSLIGFLFARLLLRGGRRRAVP